jgi:hypothetical protein
MQELLTVLRMASFITYGDLRYDPGLRRSAGPEALNEFSLVGNTARSAPYTRALTEFEFEALGNRVGLELRRRERDALSVDLDDLLAGSFPKPGDADRL